MRRRRYFGYWTYWLIVLGALGFAMIFGVAVGASVGMNPYIAASISGGAYILYETYQVRRHVG